MKTDFFKPANKLREPLKWLRDNLFNTWYNSILTFISLVFLYMVLKFLFAWILFEAHWQVIPANLNLFMTGTYPAEEKWRIWTVVFTIKNPINVIIIKINTTRAISVFTTCRPIRRTGINSVHAGIGLFITEI